LNSHPTPNLHRDGVGGGSDRYVKTAASGFGFSDKHRQQEYEATKSRKNMEQPKLRKAFFLHSKSCSVHSRRLGCTTALSFLEKIAVAPNTWHQIQLETPTEPPISFSGTRNLLGVRFRRPRLIWCLSQIKVHRGLVYYRCQLRVGVTAPPNSRQRTRLQKMSKIDS
jgi:hypothetical protein